MRISSRGPFFDTQGKIPLKTITIIALFIQAGIINGAPVVINEFLASNDKTVADVDGDYTDWIELYNSGEAIQLTGYHLSDDPDEPEKWTFPDYTSQSVIEFFEKVREHIAQEENV